MRADIKKLYDEHKDELEMFNFHPDEEDDEKTDSYVYAWFVKNTNHKYFYVGKGKNKRYNHIIKEIDDIEKNPRKCKGKAYKILKDRIGIECEILYESLTEAESSVLEAYTIYEYLGRKEPLLNVILPAGICENEEIASFRDSYFYEKNEDKFLEYYV